MRTLLLADDSITVQRVIALTFASEPIRVVAVADGQQAMAHMAAQQPDIVLAGTTLPQVSGYDLARFMRGKAELQNVPVLLLTGAFETVDEARLAASGANGVLEKPIEPKLVISRVKELLGLKSDDTPATPGRLITPADGAAGKKPPATASPRSVTNTRETPAKPEPPRNQSGPAAKPVEAAAAPDGYLDTLDAAFDSLDSQLSGRAPSAKSPRNPSGPIGPSAGPADPRSPGRTPTLSAGGNPVFEVDDDWFSSAESKARSDLRAGRREIAEDLRDPSLQGTPPATEPPAAPVFEVDEDWFAEDNKARAARQQADQELAKEMGIHDVDLPEVPASLNLPAAASGLDFDFGIADARREAAPSAESPAAVPTPKQETPIETVSPIVAAGETPKTAAEDFAALLAVETGERRHPPAATPPEIKVVTPEVTDEMLEQIASRVADHLSAGAFGAKLQVSMLTTMREAVREIVAETSERIIRDAVPAVIAETAERVIRDSVPAVVADVSEHIVRETVPAVAAEISARVVRDTVPGVVADASERLVRDTVPGVVAETSERLVRGTLTSVVSETSERIVREAVPAAVAETAERLVRNSVDVVLTETSERFVRDAVRTVVSETSERLVREEIERIRSKNA